MTDEHDQAMTDLAVWLREDPTRSPVLDDRPMSSRRMAEIASQITNGETTAIDPTPTRSTDSAIHPPTAARHRRRKRIALAAVPLMTAALAAAGWAALREDATQATSFKCLAPGVAIGIPNDGSPPLDVCRDLWEQGAVLPDVTTAPQLVACVDDDGTVAVVQSEGPDTCADRGGSEWADQPTYQAIGEAITAVRADLHDRFRATGNACATVADWRDGLGDQPAAADWTIDVNQVEPNRHCYDVGSVEPNDHRITLVGMPGDHSIGCDPRTGC